MTTHDLNIANASGSAVRTDLNNALSVIASNSSDANPIPGANSYPYQWQVRTDVNKLYMRDASTNTTWHEVGDVGVANLGLAKLASPTFTGAVGIANGTGGTPALSFSSDGDTGLYRAGANQLAVSASGTSSHIFKSDGSEPQVPLKATNGSNSAPSLTFASDTNLGLYRSAADTLSITTGGTERASFTDDGLNIKAQLDLRLYDSNSSNYAAIQAPSNIGTNYTLTLPTTDGGTGEFLKTDGSGNLSWDTPADQSTVTDSTYAANVRTSAGSNESTAASVFQGRAKAWVNFNGQNTPTIRDSYNVSSLTDIEAASYWVNFTNNFANVNYCTSSHGRGDSQGGARIVVGKGTPEVGRYRLQTRNANNSNEEIQEVCASWFGD